MSARFEIVRTDADQPWHARFVAANGRTVWTTEQYVRRGKALAAVELICGSEARSTPFNEHLEIAWAKADEPTEIRYVDERTGKPASITYPAVLGQWARGQKSVMALVREGKKINAIRELRILTGAGLLDAKTAIEMAAREPAS